MLAPTSDVAASESFLGRHSGAVSGTSAPLAEAFPLSMPGVVEPRISSEPQVIEQFSVLLLYRVLLLFPAGIPPYEGCASGPSDR